MRILPGTSIGENEVAARCGVSRIPVRDAFRLIANLKSQKDLIESDEMVFDFASKFMMLDNEFHRILFELAGRESVWLYLEKGRNHYDRFRIFINQDDHTKIRGIYQQHEQLVEAIKNKDVESA